MKSKLLKILPLITLILAEALYLGIVFDADSLKQLPHGWWTLILSCAGRIMPLAAVIATGSLLLAAPRVRDRLQGHPFIAPLKQSLLFLILQILSYAWLSLITRSVFTPTDAVMRHTGIFVSLWLASAAITGLLWLATLVDLSAIVSILRDCRRPLALCFSISLAAWFLGLYTQHWWKPLRGLTLKSAYVLLRLTDSSAWIDVSKYEIGAGPHFGVEISRQCSGYEGIGLIWMFLLGYFFVFRKQLRFPRALLLLPAATLVAWCANTLRIAALVAIGAHASPAIALGGFHSYAGILLVSAIALSTGGIAHRAPFFNRSSPVPASTFTENPVAPWLAPFLIVLLIGMLTSIFKTNPLDPLYFVRVLVAAGILWHFRHLYKTFDCKMTVAPLALGAMIFIVWISTYRAPASVLPFAPAAAGFWILFRCAGSILVAPFVEELAFRGYLARRFTAADFDRLPLQKISPIAILLSSLAFAAMHGSATIPQFLAGLLAGVAYALAAKRRGRITDAILAHAITNALLCFYILHTHAWTLWL